NRNRIETMTIDRLHLAELVEKGSDADLLREMMIFTINRMMDLDVEISLAPPTANDPTPEQISATATASGLGTRRSVHCQSPSLTSGGAVIPRRFSRLAAPPTRRSSPSSRRHTYTVYRRAPSTS